MLDDYLQGAATQLIERASALKGQIPRPPRIEFAQLASLCCTKIDIAIGELRKIRDDPDWRGPAAASVRLLEFRRIAAQIDRVENEAIAAMTLSGRKEAPFNQLLYRMTQEINYPIELPTISLLSQNYFYINTDFKLLCVPLMELHFLLHLPDVYHELAHPLLQAEDDPRTKLWLDAFLRTQSSIGDHFRNQIIEANSARGPDFIRFALAAAYENFQFQWLEEFFCDLFGVFSVGPAYAWAHLHLHAERGNNAFLLPRPRSRHPADAPRMEMMLDGLLLLNEAEAAAEIEGRWKNLLALSGQSEPADYHRYYPKRVLRKCAEEAFDGFTAVGCKPWPDSDGNSVRRTLNTAWQRFWDSPKDFVAWEKQTTARLLSWEQMVSTS